MTTRWWYTCITYKHVDYSYTETYAEVENFLKTLWSPQAIIILEKGSNNDNPHLNLVYQSTRRHDSLTRSFIKIAYKKGYKSTTKYDVRTKHAYNHTQLIGGYLHKEAQSEILYNHKFDLKAIKKDVVHLPKVDVKSKTCRRSDLHLHAHEFAVANELEIKGLHSYRQLIRLMIKSGYYIPFHETSVSYAHYQIMFIDDEADYADRLLRYHLKIPSKD